MPEGKELKEEVIENSKKITTQQQWYRRRADKLLAAAARRSTKVGGGAPKVSAAAARPAHGSNTNCINVSARVKGPSIKYVTLFLANFDTLPPVTLCHT